MSTSTITINSLRRDLGRAGLSDVSWVSGDPHWDSARQAWNLAIDQHPAAVVAVETPGQVIRAVELARDSGLSIIAQGTGHSATAYGPLEGSLLIKTSRLDGVSVRGSRCRVGAGVLWAEAADAAGHIGMAGLGGSSPDVGVVGYSLGGGIGWLARPFGLASNAVRSIDIVMADGAEHRIHEKNLPEVFWALRGGGGGLGVVTALEFELFPVSHVHAGTLVWEARFAPTIFAAWRDWTATMELRGDHTTTSILRYLSLPDAPGIPDVFRGRRMVTLGFASVADPDRAAANIDDLRSVVAPELDTSGLLPSSALCRLHGDPEGPTAGLSHHRLLGPLDADALDTLDGVAGVDSGSGLVSVELRHLGGALATPPAGAGALSHISAPYVLNAVGAAHDPEMYGATFAELGGVVDAMAPWDAGSYLNFVERPTSSVFDRETAARLGAVKAAFDPDRIFTLRSGL